MNHVGGVMVSILVSNAVDREFDSRSGQTQDYEMVIRCFSVMHTEYGERAESGWL